MTGSRDGAPAPEDTRWAPLYVASQFESYGLEPAGDKGSYLQRVPFLEIAIVPERCESTFAQDGKARALRWGTSS